MKKTSGIKTRITSMERRRRHALLACAIVLLLLSVAAIAVLHEGKIVAVVNGEAISRSELEERLIRRAGRQMLEELIEEKLIFQEAQKKKISVDEEEIDRRFDQMRKSVVDQAGSEENRKVRNMSASETRERIRIELLAKKLLEQKITVSDSAVRDYYEQNKALYNGARFEDVKDKIKAELIQERLRQIGRGLSQELRGKAKIEILMQ